MTPVAHTYEEVKDAVRQVALNHHRRRGGDLDELVGEANLAYMKAYAEYEVSRGCFERWVKYRVRHELLENARRLARRAELLPRAYTEMTELGAEGLDVLCQLAKELGEEADEVVRLCFSGPKGEKPKDVRERVKLTLRLLGWSLQKIRETFQEIQEALQ